MSLTWLAEYSNGEVIRETEKQINYHQLNRTLLKTLKLINDVGEVKAEVTTNQGEVLFYRIRTVCLLGGSVVGRLYFLGWRKRENNEIETHIITLTPEGEKVDSPRPFQTDYWAPEEQV